MAKNGGTMTIIEHMSELRWRLMAVVFTILLATIVCFVFSGDILDLMSQDLILIFIRPGEALMAHIRLAFTAGIMASLPIVFYHIVAFLAPALSGKEKRVLLAAVFLMFILFFAGLAFAWFVAFPYAMNFFASFASENLLPYYTISEYVSFVTGFLLGFGLVFQVPLLFWVLGALGLVTSKFLRKNRKYALVVIVIVAAIITPPDVVSQVLMALPMLALYELGILLVIVSEAGRKKKAANETGEI